MITPYVFARELFYALTLTLALFFALELAKPNIVQTYIPLNGVLLLWVAAGMVTVYLGDKKTNHRNND